MVGVLPVGEGGDRDGRATPAGRRRVGRHDEHPPPDAGEDDELQADADDEMAYFDQPPPNTSPSPLPVDGNEG